MSTQSIDLQSNIPSSEILEKVLVAGDLMKLTPAERVSYYGHVCRSLGLNPLTKPFEYIVLNGKLTLYARKDCTDQLRKIHQVSVDSVEHNYQDPIGIYVVTARGHDSSGRFDTGTGAVSVAGLKGDALANSIMKSETKAKRRLTLSLCGLGMLDETEIESIPDAQPFNNEPAQEPIKKTTAKPATPQQAAQPATAPVQGEVVGGDVISEKQIKMLFAVQKSANVTDAKLKPWLAAKGITTRKAIPKAMFQDVLGFIDPEYKFHTRSNQQQQTEEAW